MVRDEFLGAAGASGGGGGGDLYASAVLQMGSNLGSRFLYRFSPTGLGARYVYPTSSGDPNFAIGTGYAVFNRQQNAILGTGFGASSYSATFNPAVAAATPFGTYYTNYPFLTSTRFVETYCFNKESNAIVAYSTTQLLKSYGFNPTSGWIGPNIAAPQQPSVASTATALDLLFLGFGANESVLVAAFNDISNSKIFSYLWGGASSGLGTQLPITGFTPPQFQVAACEPQISPSGNVLCYVTGSSTTSSGIYLFDITTGGLVFKSSIPFFTGNGTNQIVSKFEFSPTGGAILFSYRASNWVDTFQWSDSTGVGNFIQRKTETTTSTSSLARLSFSITSDSAYVAIIAPKSTTGNGTPSQYRVNIYSYSDASGIGSLTGFTDVTTSGSTESVGDLRFS